MSSSSSSSSSSIFGFQRWTSIYEAKRLLNLSNINTKRTTSNKKEEIEIAFRNAAKMYHPDSTSMNSQPCPIKFRQCLEARDLLLRELIPQTTTRPPTARGTSYSSYSPNHPYNYQNSSYHNHHHRNNKKDYFGKGFPFQTLRLLTLKQKLIIRGSIMILVSLGALYDRNIRIKIQQQREQQQKT